LWPLNRPARQFNVWLGTHWRSRPRLVEAIREALHLPAAAEKAVEIEATTN
jgi:hypothetical protein